VEVSSRNQIAMALLAMACLTGGCRKKPVTLGTPIGAETTQLVTVVTEGWNRFQATLRRYERSPGGAWKVVGAPIDVVLGREGYGWGRGLHGGGAPTGRPGPTKREGDGRSPAGVFEVGTVYGYEAERERIALPYVQATPALRCVDDPASRHYNRIVSTANTSIDWKSAEYMRREDELYEIAIVVEHNTRQTEPGAGSCIFIHVWRGPNSGMTGCTAMPLETLETISAWLRTDAAVLVALPRDEYDALRGPWDLPR
jgi:L,D-peptidoglycan transpeptidase YkuD (ErfK/YbiS/YcfS/YnhG family)